MEFSKKLFVSRQLDEDEFEFVKESLEQVDLVEHLKHSFIYVSIYENGTLEIVSVKDEYVYLVSKEYYIDNKMSMEYLRNRDEIKQKLNEVLYWNGINDLKKYVTVVFDNGINKRYSDDVVYAESIAEAISILDKMYVDEYMYIEDVDGEV
jgi:hypothetical protein